MTKTLVAYFSASGVTKQVAQNLAKAANADIFEIKPTVPYTNDDLNWLDKNSRSTVEMKDWSSRPEIIDENAHIENYETIFLGFPIWWYIAPTIINTFLEKYDFSNKKIVLFATSGGSRFGRTVENIKPSVSNSTEIIEGDILNSNFTIEELKQWVDNLNL
ncbi:NAD(P)H-dependent oxidoreductase [bacterium]|nr:NAD(P)H-dependent oxidoreductase [bacterium]